MAKIGRVNVYGLEESIQAAKYPKAVDVYACNSDLTNGIQACSSCKTGEGHDNFLNGIIVQFDLTMSNKAWVEAERYHFLDFVSSQSTMHKASQFQLTSMYNEYVDSALANIVESKRLQYLADPTPENYLKLLYNIPSGFELTARMTTNYRQLKTIYQQRRHHRLPDWRVVCDWIETLPRFMELTQRKENNNAN